MIVKLLELFSEYGRCEAATPQAIIEIVIEINNEKVAKLSPFGLLNMLDTFTFGVSKIGQLNLLIELSAIKNPKILGDLISGCFDLRVDIKTKFGKDLVLDFPQNRTNTEITANSNYINIAINIEH